MAQPPQAGLPPATQREAVSEVGGGHAELSRRCRASGLRRAPQQAAGSVEPVADGAPGITGTSY